MELSKAVIPAAGFGTRFLPVTKAQPKEMMPVLDKPTIQYVVEEAVAAGIDDILIVTGRGKETIQRHFDKAYELERELQEAGKVQRLEQVRSISELPDIHYVRQKERNGLGDAVLCAEKHVGSEPFALLLGDTIIRSDPSCTSRLVGFFTEYNDPIVSLVRVPHRDVSSYGVAAIDRASTGSACFPVRDFIEKPAPEVAPSNLAITGRYVLTPEIFDLLAETKPGVGGELQLTDAIRKYPTVRGVELQGTRYDIGDIPSWLGANLHMALHNDGEMGDTVEKVIKQEAD